MSTNALVVVSNEQQEWEGTYVHWDGYQLHFHLIPIVQRDGLVQALDTLFSHSWSSLEHECPTEAEIEAAEPDEKRESIAGYHKWLRNSGMEKPGKVVPGYGTPNGPYEPCTPKSYSGYPEFIYVIGSKGLFCYDACNTPEKYEEWHLLRFIAWDDHSELEPLFSEESSSA